jgi:hypothetical protein
MPGPQRRAVRTDGGTRPPHGPLAVPCGPGPCVVPRARQRSGATGSPWASPADRPSRQPLQPCGLVLDRLESPRLQRRPCPERRASR